MLTRMTLGIRVAVVVLSFCAAPPAVEGAYLFTRITVPFAGVFATGVTGINNNGQIVGTYIRAATDHSFLLASGGQFQAFLPVDAPFANTTATYANGINDGGQIVGTYHTGGGLGLPTFDAHGFLDAGGVFTSIDAPFFAVTDSFVDGINNAGQMVGSYTDAGGFHGFVGSAGSFISIDVPVPNAAATSAFGINSSGRVVGPYTVAGVAHGFLWIPGGQFAAFSLFDDPVSGGDTIPVGINDAGQIVGDYDDATGRHGFLDDGGVFTTIDVPFADAGTTSLSGINNHGQIVGSYRDFDGFHGFVATPIPLSAVPLPRTGLLLGAGLTCLAVGRRRQIMKI